MSVADFILGTLAATDDYPHPIVSADGHWIGVAWLVIGGLFLAAAVIGPIVRANAPEASEGDASLQLPARER